MGMLSVGMVGGNNIFSDADLPRSVMARKKSQRV